MLLFSKTLTVGKQRPLRPLRQQSDWAASANRLLVEYIWSSTCQGRTFFESVDVV